MHTILCRLEKTVTSWLMLSILLSACVTETDHQPTNKELAATYNAQLGLAYMGQGEMVRAKVKFTKALILAPHLPLANYAIGHYYEKTGELNNAEQAFQKAIRLGGKAGDPHHHYGTFLCRQKRYAQSLVEFSLAVKDKDYAYAAKSYENAGLCSMAAGDNKTAARFFQMALQHDAQSPNALIELAHFDFAAKNYTDARSKLETYRRLGYTNPRSLWLGIRIADKVGDKDTEASLKLLLTHDYPEAAETRMMQETLKE